MTSSHTTPPSAKTPAPRKRRRRAPRGTKAAAPSLDARITRGVSAEPLPPVAHVQVKRHPVLRAVKKEEPAPDSGPLSERSQLAWEVRLDSVLALLNGTGKAGATMQDLKRLDEEKAGRGALTWSQLGIALTHLTEWRGSVVCVENRDVTGSRYYLSEHAPKAGEQGGEPIAKGEPMEPVESWRARRQAQAQGLTEASKEYYDLCASKASLDSASLPALLLYGLGYFVGEPGYMVEDLLGEIRRDLEILAEAMGHEDHGCAVLTLARRLHVAQELLNRERTGR